MIILVGVERGASWSHRMEKLRLRVKTKFVLKTRFVHLITKSARIDKMERKRD